MNSSSDAGASPLVHVRAALLAFTKDALSEFWTRDTADIQESGIKHGLLVEAFYDPEKHGDVEDAEPGDSIYVYADWFKAALAGIDGAGEKAGITQAAVIGSEPLPTPLGEEEREALSKLYDEFNTDQIDAATFGYRVFDVLSNFALSHPSKGEGEKP